MSVRKYTFNEHIKPRIPEMSLAEALERWGCEYDTVIGARKNSGNGLTRVEFMPFLMSILVAHPLMRHVLSVGRHPDIDEFPELRHFALRIGDSVVDTKWLYLWNIALNGCMPYLYGDQMHPMRYNTIDFNYNHKEEQKYWQSRLTPQ